MLGYRYIAAAQPAEPGGLTGRHRAREQLDLYAADCDRPVEVGGRLTGASGLLDALADTRGLLRGVDQGAVDAGMQARRVGEVQHGADGGDDDQHADCCRHRYPVPQRHGASRRT